MVLCYLYLPVADVPSDSVLVATLTLAEWNALAEWARSRQRTPPRLVRLLTGSLPIQVEPGDVLALSAECARADWDRLAVEAPRGFGALARVISQAADQPGAGLEFAAIAAKPG